MKILVQSNFNVFFFRCIELLFTEWFDVDEPCLYGDTEDVIQNLAWTFNFKRTAPWRLCSKAFRKGTGEIETTQGHDIPRDQVVTTVTNRVRVYSILSIERGCSQIKLYH